MLMMPNGGPQQQQHQHPACRRLVYATTLLLLAAAVGIAVSLVLLARDDLFKHVVAVPTNQRQRTSNIGNLGNKNQDGIDLGRTFLRVTTTASHAESMKEPIEPQQRRLRILMFGDSLTVGGMYTEDAATGKL